jgi:hypothetical protein
MDVIEQLGVLMEIVAPCGHFIRECGNAIDDGHEGWSVSLKSWAIVAQMERRGLALWHGL